MGTFVSMPMEATQNLTATSLARPNTLSQHPAVYAIFSVCAAEQQGQRKSATENFNVHRTHCLLFPSTKGTESEDQEREVVLAVRGLHNGHHPAVSFLQNSQVLASKFGPISRVRGACRRKETPSPRMWYGKDNLVARTRL